MCLGEDHDLVVVDQFLNRSLQICIHLNSRREIALQISLQLEGRRH